MARFSLCWVVIARFGLFWVVYAHLRSLFGSFLSCFASFYVSLLACLELFWLILDCFGSFSVSFWLILAHLRSPFGLLYLILSRCIVLCRLLFWLILGLSELVLACFGWFGFTLGLFLACFALF